MSTGGQTPVSSPVAYMSVNDLITFVDIRVIAQLVMDDGTQQTPAQLQTNPTIIEIILAASGEIESFLLASERYSTVDLSAPNGASQAYLKLLCSKLAAFECYMRRTGPMPETVLAMYEQAQEQLKELRQGDRILSFAESLAAGVAEDSFMNLGDLGRLGRFTDQCARALGIQADERRGPYGNGLR